MEAKVDIRKLQLLNDRINQTIDALNQVRLSVTGLAHTAALGQIGQVGGYPNVSPFAAQAIDPRIAMLAGCGGQTSFGGIGGFGAQAQPMVPGFGLAHTGAVNPLLAQSPLLSQIGYPGAFGVQGYGSPAFGQTPFGWTGTGGGLTHTSPVTDVRDYLERQVAEACACDPTRIARTFPLALGAVPGLIGW